MTGSFESLRRTVWLWSVPLAFCIVGLLIFVFYHSFYAGEVERLDALYQQGLQDLDALENSRERVDLFLARVELQEEGVESLYSDHLQTQRERFTRSLAEVRRLAHDAGLAPAGMSYPQAAQGGLVQRRIQFGVEGNYQQLRQFINLLELSDQFLTLKSISLTGGEGNRLGIQLQLSTVFADSEEAAAARASSRGDAVEDSQG